MNKILLSTATAFILSLTACSSHAPEKRVHRILTDRIQTLAVAESCTGGTIAARFTALPGASAYFKCGVVAYSLDTKQEILQISCDTIARYGAVSEQVVRRRTPGFEFALCRRHYRHRRPYGRNARISRRLGMDRRQLPATHHNPPDPCRRQPQRRHPKSRNGGHRTARRRIAGGKSG